MPRTFVAVTCMPANDVPAVSSAVADDLTATSGAAVAVRRASSS